MPGTFRTLVRWSGAIFIVLSLFSANQAQTPGPIEDKTRPSVNQVKADSAKTEPSKVDSAKRALGKYGSSKTDSSKTSKVPADTGKPALPNYALESPWLLAQPCREGVENASECWRRLPDLANQEIGFSGTRGTTLSLTNWQSVPVNSPFFSGWRHSPYGNGGLAPPEKFALQLSGGDAQAIEEVWTPVVPLDTPMTRLYWERGPITLNVFDLRLRRMLSDRVYLAMDYYSASADSQTYDYQFNVHQPFLGGVGFLGQIYGPIDRDSASLVLSGISHNIQAVAIRPRVGVWLDTNRVFEVFFDQVKNSTNLTSPQGPRTLDGITRPGAVDSFQTLVPAKFSSTSQGALYAMGHAQSTSQWEASHASLNISEFRSGDSLTGGTGKDELQADIFKLRGTWRGAGIMGQPFVSAQARSETWEGKPILTTVTGDDKGWTDAQEAEFGLRPTVGILAMTADAGLGRSSRMNNQIYWLERYGTSAKLDLPWGFDAEAGTSFRRQDADWETLYRRNAVRFRSPNTKLKPRGDRGFRGSLAWSIPHLSLQSGLDLFQSEDAWLPRVLPGPGTCASLADSLYQGLESNRCNVDSSGLPDSLALTLRNYSQQTIEAWHLGLGLGLGNWSLDLNNRFLFTRSVTDPSLFGKHQDLSVPGRVFKGRLAWKRSLVEDKLKLDLSWDWEWFSTRYGWAPDGKGNSKVGKLDEYLTLDFQAAMHIKTFTLYFRSMNMNHDRYATELGVHPTGINFRFGVDWILSN